LCIYFILSFLFLEKLRKQEMVMALAFCFVDYFVFSFRDNNFFLFLFVLSEAIVQHVYQVIQ